MKRKHRMTALLGALMMLSTCTMSFLPVQAVYLTEDAHLTVNDASGFLLKNGICYSTEGDIITDEIPQPGTYDCTARLLEAVNKNPDGFFAVEFCCWGDGGFDTQTEIERLRRNKVWATVTENGSLYAILNSDLIEDFPADDTVGYQLWLAEKPASPKHTSEVLLTKEVAGFIPQNFNFKTDGRIYCSKKNGEFSFDDYVPSPGTYDRSALLLLAMYKYPERRFGVQFIGYKKDGFAGEEEIGRLQQLGIEASVLENGMLYALLDADQLENFPADPSIGYLMGLSADPNPPPPPVHTFEGTLSDEFLEEYLAQHEGHYFLGDDGIFYSIPEYWDFIYDLYVPNGGTYDRTELLLALLHAYPEGRFAVHFHSWAAYDYEDIFDAEAELERLRQNGIDVRGNDYMILNAEQLANFPVDESVGYLMGLAPRPEDIEPEQPTEEQPLPQLSEERLDEVVCKYIMDGVFYNSPELWGFVYEGCLPGEGTFSHSDFMKALLKQFPDGSFSIRFMQGDVEKGYVEKTVERLRQIGLEVSPTEAEDIIQVTIQDEEQLTIFVEDGMIRYMMGLAPKPSVPVMAGDTNLDDKVGLMDVVCLQKYLLRSTAFDENQWNNADINQDGEVDVFDLALLKRMLLES